MMTYIPPLNIFDTKDGNCINPTDKDKEYYKNYINSMGKV